MTNQLKKLNPTLFQLIVGFGLLDIAFGFGTILFPYSQASVCSQNPVIPPDWQLAIGVILLTKGVLILTVNFLSMRYQVTQKLLVFGVIFWSILALLSLVGLVHGNIRSIMSFPLLCFMVYFRWIAIKFVPPKEMV